jgi:spore maturation protein CgeB
MAEALAASQCLISEPTVAYLPADMPHTSYQSTDECIAACDYYLSHPSVSKELQNLAWKYYRSAVEPSAHVKRVLDSITWN